MHISSCSLLSLKLILVWNGMRLGLLICVKYSKIEVQHASTSAEAWGDCQSVKFATQSNTLHNETFATRFQLKKTFYVRTYPLSSFS